MIAVNDCSTDGTAELSAASAVLSHLKSCITPKIWEKARHSARALRRPLATCSSSGCRSGIRSGGLSPAPRPLLTGKADVVVWLALSHHRQNTGSCIFGIGLATRCFTLLCNAVADVNLTDMETGSKAFRREVLKALTLEQTGSAVSRKSPSKWRVHRCGCMK